MMMKKLLCLSCLLMLVLFTCVVAGTEQKSQKAETQGTPCKEHEKLEADSSETESKVPELMEFHEVIYPIWHNAYPNKDYAALRSFVPDVNRHAENVYNAKLPGILRDKEAKWKEGVAELKKAVEEYNTAAKGTNDEALLDAAEVLHAKYEMMIRIIWPVSKEVDAFHKILYVIYHKYLPNEDYDRVKEVSSELTSKAEDITKAQLSKRLQAKAEQFKTAAQSLLYTCKGLQETCKAGSSEAIEKSVEDVHTKYQTLVGVFE